MSEFSESYHLKGKTQEEGVELLKRAGVRGYVFPEKNGWITILDDEESCLDNENLINANKGLLLHYMYAEDHGWRLSIYHNQKKEFDYQCDWDGINIDDSETNIDFIKAVIGKKNIDEVLHKILYPTEEDIFSDDSPAYRMAELLSLTNFQWMSYDNVRKDGLMDDRYNGVIKVQ